MMGPALSAKVADLGASTLLKLDADQAQALEAFIAANTATIEFKRSVGNDEAGAAIIETVNADVLIDGESFQVDLPAGGQWACDQNALRAALA
jgi:hypothetical protein